MAQKINRRRFLKLFGAGSAVLTASLYGCDNKAQKTVMKEKAPGDVPTDKMTYRVNPKTKDKISILGYGMMRLPNIEQKASKDGKPTESVIDQEQVNRLVKYALDHCQDDIAFLNKMYDNTLIDRLNSVLKDEFVRLTYTEGIKILEESGAKFEFPVKWGVDLQSEHERYLVEHHFKRPVILTDYPKDIKAFYMKQNDDGKTVRAMDVLFPQIGEIIGGSEREADYDKLMNRIQELHIPMKDMWWYLDTRRFGTVPHSGFGLGFERLILFVTGMANIRDVIPFPRTPNNCEF